MGQEYARHNQAEATFHQQTLDDMPSAPGYEMGHTHHFYPLNSLVEDEITPIFSPS
jgi:hypothetical protein